MTRRIPALWLAVAGVLVAPLLSAPLLAQSGGKEEAPISPAATAAVEKAAKAKAASTAAPVPAAVPAASDLELMLLYDADSLAESIGGERSLSTAQYYARLTQRLITALTAHTAEGALYEVDMRLRPSGQKAEQVGTTSVPS